MKRDLYDTLCLVLRRKLVGRQLTYAAIARETGLSVRSVARVFAGSRDGRVSLTCLERIADAYHIDLLWEVQRRGA